MIFYLGGYPRFLWGTSNTPAANVPLFVSRSTLNPLNRKSRFPRAKSPWALDSGGFKELERNGRWTVSPEQYVREVRRLAEEVGNLQWAAIQDWMCEPPILYGGPTDPGSRAVGTGLSVEEHQLRTIESYCRLRELGGREMAGLWAPVLQGWCLEDYVEHVHLWTTVGRVDLSEVPVIGVGSVCRRQGTEMASALFRILAEQFGLGGRLHAFGSKTTGLQLQARVGQIGTRDEGVYAAWAAQQIESGWPLSAIQDAMLFATQSGPSTWEESEAEVCSLLQSGDSFAWSYEARAHANAVRKKRDEEWGGPGRSAGERTRWSQVGDKIVVSGRVVGKIHHELAGRVHPFAPTQMLSSCSKGFASGSRGQSHQSCSTCVRYALAWRSALMGKLPRDCRGTRPPKRPKITGVPICASAERVADKQAEIMRYKLELERGMTPPDPKRWERLKAMPGAEGPLLPVHGLRAVYPRMTKPRKGPPLDDVTCRAWGTGDFRWGEARTGEDLPAAPSPWQPGEKGAAQKKKGAQKAKRGRQGGTGNVEMFPLTNMEMFPRGME